MKMYMGGQWVDKSEQIDVVNPFDGSIIDTVPKGDRADVSTAIESAERGAKAMAAMDGRPNVTTNDVRKVAVPVLRHRVSTNFQAQAEGMASEDIIEKLVATVAEPNIPKYEK